MSFSIEPYDMNPTADLELGTIADVPMSEFWSKGLGFNSSFSVVEATSIAHVNGRSLTPAEAFTAQNDEGWKQYPGAMKNQGDWAFAAGVNRFVYHTFQNQFLPDSLRPGATMGPYGVHWDRNQTWWPMVGSYHEYISRCSYLLQQGNTVADILYLNPEGSPHVFRPPFSAFKGNDTVPDRKGYNFDGCAPSLLYKATVVNGNIMFPGGASYKLLVLPAVPTMTPTLLNKIAALVKAGATVVGPPPLKSPSLVNYPACDSQISLLAQQVWGTANSAAQQTHHYGKGRVIFSGDVYSKPDNLYPHYDVTASILKSMGVAEDFTSDGTLRYTHRASANWDAYFVANNSSDELATEVTLRLGKGTPQLWDPLTGKTIVLSDFTRRGNQTTISLKFTPYQSFFVVFAKDTQPAIATAKKKNYSTPNVLSTLDGPWQVAFDPKWGGPKSVTFDTLTDWTKSPEDGIKYYSGTATYSKTFDMPVISAKGKYFIDLGEVKNLARIKLNGKDLGILWTAPWRKDIPASLLKSKNTLEVEVVNLWLNRLIGDAGIPDDGIRNGRWPEWLLKGQPRPGKRYTFATHRFYNKNSPLSPSGLTGPVRIVEEK